MSKPPFASHYARVDSPAALTFDHYKRHSLLGLILNVLLYGGIVVMAEFDTTKEVEGSHHTC